MVGWVTETKITWTIRNFGNHKAAGPDGLTPIVLKQLPNMVLKRLRTIFVSSIFSGYVSRSWRKSRVVFIPKSGKGDYTKVKYFHTITPSSFLKTMKRVVLAHLEEAYDIYNRLKAFKWINSLGPLC